MTAPRTPSEPDERPRTWFGSARHLNMLHRIGAVVMGLALGVFGLLGLVDRLDFFSTSGEPVLGLSSNGLLSVISLAVGAVLVAAGARGGRGASTVAVVVGIAFMLSGFANVLVLGTSANVLAFRLPNVIFSEVAGGALLIMGAFGRFTSKLPSTNPYEQERHPDQVLEIVPPASISQDDVAAVSELAEAERAHARHAATPAQAKGVSAAGAHRRTEDRIAGWHSNEHPRP